MLSLVIYDNKGYVYMVMSGNSPVPQGGIQYIKVEIPTGKIIKSIDTSVTPNIPVYDDIPLTENEILKQRIAEQETAIMELAELIGGAV